EVHPALEDLGVLGVLKGWAVWEQPLKCYRRSISVANEERTCHLAVQLFEPDYSPRLRGFVRSEMDAARVHGFIHGCAIRIDPAANRNGDGLSGLRVRVWELWPTSSRPRNVPVDAD